MMKFCIFWKLMTTAYCNYVFKPLFVLCFPYFFYQKKQHLYYLNNFLSCIYILYIIYSSYLNSLFALSWVTWLINALLYKEEFFVLVTRDCNGWGDAGGWRGLPGLGTNVPCGRLWDLLSAFAPVRGWGGFLD